VEWFIDEFRRFEFLRAFVSSVLLWLGGVFLETAGLYNLERMISAISMNGTIYLLLLSCVTIGAYLVLFVTAASYFFRDREGGLSQGVMLGAVCGLFWTALSGVENIIRYEVGLPVIVLHADISGWIVMMLVFGTLGFLNSCQWRQ
jgi:hypothetical protein